VKEKPIEADGLDWAEVIVKSIWLPPTIATVPPVTEMLKPFPKVNTPFEIVAVLVTLSLTRRPAVKLVPLAILKLPPDPVLEVIVPMKVTAAAEAVLAPTMSSIVARQSNRIILIIPERKLKAVFPPNFASLTIEDPIVNDFVG
jgi:hypothetical protein